MDVTEMNGHEPRKSPATATTYTAGAPRAAMQAGEAGFSMLPDAPSFRGRASASEPGCGFCPTAYPRRLVCLLTREAVPCSAVQYCTELTSVVVAATICHGASAARCTAYAFSLAHSLREHQCPHFLAAVLEKPEI